MLICVKGLPALQVINLVTNKVEYEIPNASEDPNYVCLRPISGQPSLIILKDMKYISAVDLEKRRTIKLFKCSNFHNLRTDFLEVSTIEEGGEIQVEVHSLDYHLEKNNSEVKYYKFSIKSL